MGTIESRPRPCHLGRTRFVAQLFNGGIHCQLRYRRNGRFRQLPGCHFTSAATTTRPEAGDASGCVERSEMIGGIDGIVGSWRTAACQVEVTASPARTYWPEARRTRGICASSPRRSAVSSLLDRRSVWSTRDMLSRSLPLRHPQSTEHAMPQSTTNNPEGFHHFAFAQFMMSHIRAGCERSGRPRLRGQPVPSHRFSSQ